MTQTLARRAGPAVDVIETEIVRYALQELVDEMTVALVRSAFSVNIKTRFDMSCALFDADCRLLAQSETICQPAFVGALVVLSRKTRDAFGAERLRPGDVLVVNDPYLWATHLPDVALMAPVFSLDGSRVVAYVMCIGHHSDIGGGTPGGYVGNSTEIYQEGLVIPPIRLVREGVLDEETLELILANVRTRRDNIGDFNAKIGALAVGQARYRALQDRYGDDELQLHAEAILDSSEQAFRAALRKLPDGRYRGEDWLDDDGVGTEPVCVAVELTIADGRVVADLSASAPQVKGPFNCTPAQAFSKVFYPIKALVDPDNPVNDGCYRLIDLVAPEGSIVNPRRPAAVSMGWETGHRVEEATFLALGEALPDRAIGQSKRTIGVSAYGGIDARTGELFAYFEAVGGGYGGRPTKDGIDGIQAHSQNSADAEVEELEVNFPVIVERCEIIPDSEGPGRFRGGCGVRKVQVFPEDDIVWTCPSDGRARAPQGVVGGEAARGLRYVFGYGRDDARLIRRKTTVAVPAGTPVAIETPGGGGVGPAIAREVEAVRRDVELGKLSRARALARYGVAIVGPDSAPVVDHEATAAARGGGPR